MLRIASFILISIPLSYSESIKLLHAIDDGKFTLRHEFKTTNFPAGSSFAVKGQQSPLDLNTNSSDRYKLKLELPDGRSLMTFVSHSGLQNTCNTDIIEFFLDKNDKVTSFGYHIQPQAPKTKCKKGQFASKLKVHGVNTSPGPATEAFANQVKIETEAKQAKEAEPTSFFGKYWMYIAIFVVMMSMGGG